MRSPTNNEVFSSFSLGRQEMDHRNHRQQIIPPPYSAATRDLSERMTTVFCRRVEDDDGNWRLPPCGSGNNSTTNNPIYYKNSAMRDSCRSSSDILSSSGRKTSSVNDLPFGCSSKFKVRTKAKSACGDSNRFISSYKQTRKQLELPHEDESAAAMFFVKATEKLKLNSSPHRRKRRGSTGEDGAATSASLAGFANFLHRTPPPIPANLLRRIDEKEVTGVGKVKVILRIHDDTTAEDGSSSTGFFNVDKKRKQITLYEPSSCATSTDNMPQDRKLAIMAPKMFAFDAVFSEDDTQTEICNSALIEIVHAVISGNDGCLFCFGYSKLGKTKTMIGSTDGGLPNLGVIPCAIAWLYKGINEQKQKTGTRFSIRVSAIELTINTQQVRDLLAGYASDCEQSPGIYLRDDPLLGGGGNLLQNQSELRAGSAEKAAFYLDVALSNKSSTEESHLLYTMHVYQYNVAAGKGAVAGGRSRLHLIDLVGCDRSKPNGGLNLSGIGNVLLAIFNGQRHLPNREHKITQILKECMSSLTCHATMIAHVSKRAEQYCETLTTVQLASRIHRLRRKKIKFPGISSGVNTVDDNGRLTGSSDFEPSSSEQSADTVIYVGPSDETDGEHPPVHIPSLNSVDNRGVIGKMLKDSDVESRHHASYHVGKSSNQQQQIFNSRSVPGSPRRTGFYYYDNHRSNSPSHRHYYNNNNNNINIPDFQNTSKNRQHGTIKTSFSGGFSSAKSSPIRTNKTASSNSNNNNNSNNLSSLLSSEERWIDGPRIAKSKVAEGRNVHMMKMDGGQVSNLGKRETWVDGPPSSPSSHHTRNQFNNTNSPYSDNNLSAATPSSVAASPICPSSNGAYGFMDSYKKNMIRNWVETQCAQIQSFHHHPLRDHRTNNNNNKRYPPQYKEFTTFKMCPPADNESDNGRGSASGQEEDAGEDKDSRSEDGIHRRMNGTEHLASQLVLGPQENEAGTEFFKVQLDNYERCGDGMEENGNNSNEDVELEFIEVEVPEELVPMQDCCLQVTEEDIALCMGNLENPLPEVDQEEHPLRVLSQENMTVVSTFTDSLSVINDLDHLFPPLGRRSFQPYQSMQQQAQNQQTPPSHFHYSGATRSSDKDQVRFRQLSKLHELYKNKFRTTSDSGHNVKQQPTNSSIDKTMSISRWQSLMLSEIFSNIDNNNINTTDFENSSVASEPAYLPNEETTFGKFCENCKINLASVEGLNNNNNSSSHNSRTFRHHQHNDSYDFGSRLHSYRHIRNMLNLRHPDGASNPNLYNRDATREPGNGAEKENNPAVRENGLLQDDEDYISVPPPLPSNLLMLTRDVINRGNFTNAKHTDDNVPPPIYPNEDYRGSGTFLIDKDSAVTNNVDPAVSAEDANRYSKVRVKRLETNNWNHNKERLLDLEREQRQLINELASAKQKLFRSNGKQNGVLEFCSIPRTTTSEKFDGSPGNIQTKDPNSKKENG